MDIEPIEIRDFLAAHPLFSQLDAAARDAMACRMTVRYLPRGSDFPPDAAQPSLYILRKGTLEQRDTGGMLIAKLGEGDLFDAQCFGAHRARRGGGGQPVLPAALRRTASAETPASALRRIRWPGPEPAPASCTGSPGNGGRGTAEPDAPAGSEFCEPRAGHGGVYDVDPGRGALDDAGARIRPADRGWRPARRHRHRPRSARALSRRGCQRRNVGGGNHDA